MALMHTLRTATERTDRPAWQSDAIDILVSVAVLAAVAITALL